MITQKEEFTIEEPYIDPSVRPIAEKFRALSDRRISEATARRYQVLGTATHHYYPYFDSQGHHVSNKVRTIENKTFMVQGPIKEATLFGQQLFPPSSAKAITLFEGECDAMAGFEMSGSRFPCVSVKNAATAPRDVAENFEYLNSFETIVVCFDVDEAKKNPETGQVRYPGQEAAVKVANMFEPGKVKVLTLQKGKDSNDYLMKGLSKEYVQEWWQAPVYTPQGLKLGSSMWEEIKTPKNFKSIPYPWEGLNKFTYGIRLSELVIITADTGIGKTSILKEMEVHALDDASTEGLGLMHFEEPNADTALGLMSIKANKPLHLPDVRIHVDDNELRGYYDTIINNDRVVIWDHFGSNSIHEVLAKVRHMHNLGCKRIVIDHLSIVVSDQSGDERKQLDEIATKLKTLCMELNIAVIAVIHTNRQGQIRGTAGVEQLANIVIKLHRDKTDDNPWRRNVTKVVVEKNRFCGITGPACWLWYCPESGRLHELTSEEVKLYESGQGGLEAWPSEPSS